MNFQEDIKKIKRLASISEEAQELVKQITGKELVSYEGIDALVAALMGFYNAELKKKQNKEDSTLKTVVKTIVGAINELFTNKLEKGGYSGNAKNLNDELSKKASKTVLGRMIVGDNLTVDDNGKVSGNPPYTHPNGNGNSHLPSGGASGNFIKWLSAGAGQWANITWSDITGRPSSFTPSSHTHTGGQITQDTTHRFVSDTEKATWNSKLNKGSLPAKISDAKGLYDLIENNSGLNFDTALLYLNDAGTKYVNKIYFDRNKKGLFKCISQTTSTTNSTSYFVDISNEANSDQLRNLSKIIGNTPTKVNRVIGTTYTNDKNYWIIVSGRADNHPANDTIQILINNVNVVAFDNYGADGGFFCLVPPKATYKISGSSGIKYCYEWI